MKSDKFIIAGLMLGMLFIVFLSSVKDDYSYNTSSYSSSSLSSTSNTYTEPFYDPILELAERYVRTSPFSYSGLVDQLEYEGYERDEIYASLRNLKVDWNEMCLRHAKAYYNSLGENVSLRKQLQYEGYLYEQIEYALDNMWK